MRSSRESHGGGKWIVRLANLKKGEERERENEREKRGSALQQCEGQKKLEKKENLDVRVLGRRSGELILGRVV